MLFDVQRSEHQGWVRLAVVGELDLAAAPRVRQAVVPEIPAPYARRPFEPPFLLLDLREVDLIDSAGLGVVLGATRRARTAGGELVVVASGQVRAVFEIIGLDRIIPTYAALDDVPPAGAALAPTDGAGDG